MTKRPSGPAANGLTYAQAGVDIDAGAALVEAIKPLAKATRRPGADASLGGFGALFDLKAAGFTDPLIVSTTDGVGTKLKVAIESGHHDTVGIDLVAMCVNDLLAQGAEPLMFLDYYATGKLELEVARRVIAGIAEGCRQAGAALVGGETAEMPGMYGAGDYDLAGFSIGAVERGAVLPRLENHAAGDVLIGLASSGPHSNGYSMVRRIVEMSGLGWDAPAPFEAGVALGEGEGGVNHRRHGLHIGHHFAALLLVDEHFHAKSQPAQGRSQVVRDRRQHERPVGDKPLQALLHRIEGAGRHPQFVGAALRKRRSLGIQA